MSAPVLIVTTPTVADRTPVAIHGFVAANAVWEAAHLASRRFDEDFDFDKGRYGVYEAIMAQLERDVLRAIKTKAQALGANAVVGFSLTYGTAPLIEGSGVTLRADGDRWYAHGEGTAISIELTPGDTLTA